MELNIETIASQKEANKKKILEPLNEAQKEAAKNYRGFNVVTAGAGSGKTKLLVSRTAYMIEDGIPASSILLFTFTKKAANEIKERVESYIGEKAYGITVSTYHSFCAHQLRKYASYVGYKDNFSIIDEEQQKTIIKNCLKKIGSSAEPKCVIPVISGLKGKYINPRKFAATIDDDDDEQQEIAVVYELYEKALKKNNCMDFDDLLFYMVKVLEEHKEVQHQIWHKFKYICADECQDSSKLDLRFIMLLVNPKEPNICFTGDDQQSIYSFRGADVEHFLETMNSHEHKTFMLGQNYRSTKNIVNGAESLVRYNNNTENRKVFTDNSEGEKILHITTKTPTQEANKICQIIKNGVESGEMHYKDAAILYRTSYLSRNIENSLLRHNIPYEIIGGLSFYNRKEIKDLVSFLDFFMNPQNLFSFRRIVALQQGIGEKTIDTIVDFAGKKMASYAIITLGDTIGILNDLRSADPKEKRALKKIQNFIDKCIEIYGYINKSDLVTPAKLIKKIMVVFGYTGYLRGYDADTYDERMRNITELINFAETYDDVSEFLADALTANEEDKEEDKDEDKVKLMTIHASKGLEFPIVFIIDANDGVIPSWRCKEAEDPVLAVQEERRLFYVAMTRAKENLIIFNTDFSMRCGSMQDAYPSKFISQISKDYMEEIHL